MENHCFNHPKIEAVLRCKNCRQWICQTCSQAYRGPLLISPKFYRTQYFCPTCYIQKFKPLFLIGIPIFLILVSGILWLLTKFLNDEAQSFLVFVSIMTSMITGIYLLFLPLASKKFKRVSKIPQMKAIIKHSEVKIEKKF